MKEKKLSIIGSGNVAWHLAHRLHDCGITIKAIVSRNFDKGKPLAESVRAEFVDNFKQIPKSDIYLLSVKDDAYTSLVSYLPPSNSIYLHTSGSMEMDILKRLSPNYGVLYPFQTFTKGKELDFNQVPLCLEASNLYTKGILSQLSSIISPVHNWLDSAQRSYLQLSGVFASNFPNALFVIVKQILEKQQMDFSMAIPLIKETVAKLDSLFPEEAQTGPAARNDKKIMEKHLEMLSGTDYRNIYQLLSEVIQKQQNIE
jgi:predicted short-subunit dehydrogenase-like oxidoreductase (DUF2520 family)